MVTGCSPVATVATVATAAGVMYNKRFKIKEQVQRQHKSSAGFSYKLLEGQFFSIQLPQLGI